jgi:hypothetical protein
MKPDLSESHRTAVVIGITSLAFLLLLYLVSYIANLDVLFSYQILLIIRLTGIMSLLCGLGLLFWLLKSKPKFQSVWANILLHAFSILLIEYWYFGMRLLSLITK